MLSTAVLALLVAALVLFILDGLAISIRRPGGSGSFNLTAIGLALMTFSFIVSSWSKHFP